MKDQLMCICLVAACVLSGCGTVQVKTNMPNLRNWLENLEREEQPPGPSAYQRPAAPPVGQSSRSVAASPAKSVAPIPAPTTTKRKVVAKQQAPAAASYSATVPPTTEPAKPATAKPNNPWAIAPHP